MTYIASCFVNFLISNAIIDPKKKNIYIYGFGLFFHTVITTVCVLIIGLLSSRIVEIYILLVLFCRSQSIGGGFHASTHLRCFVCVILGVLFYLFLINLKFPLITVFSLGCISIVFLFHYPLVFHSNKSYLSSKYPFLIQQSKQFIAQCSILWIITLTFNWHSLFISISYSMFLSALSRFVAISYGKNIVFIR